MINIANLLTFSRIFLAVVFFLLMQLSGVWPVILAGFFFVIATLTDYYDGYFAKKYKITSDFGKIMDPIADKFLILTAFFVFVKMGLVLGWMFALIFLRETILTGYRLAAVTKGHILAAEKAGKLKTAFQMATVWVILLFVILKRLELFAPWDATSLQTFLDVGHMIIFAMMVGVLGLTLYSGALYLWNNRGVFFKIKT